MNLNKRILQLEEIHAPKEKPSAYIAMIDASGKVTLSHAKHDTVHLESREELNQFIAENNIPEMGVLIVDIVNAKGDPPEEL